MLAGRWGYGEDYTRQSERNARFIQSYKPTLIVLDPTLFHDDERDWITVDYVNFISEEFRQNPSPDYYDPKSNSCGLKYEFGVAIRHVRVTSLTVVVTPPQPNVAVLCVDKGSVGGWQISRQDCVLWRH